MNQGVYDRIDTEVFQAHIRDCEHNPDVACDFTGEPVVATGVPADGEPALMARMIDLLVRKRLR